MKVLVVSHACTVAAYRRKLEELVALAEMELTLLVPSVWGKAPLERGRDAGYQMRVVAPRLNGHHHLHWYPALGRILDQVQPDLVHLDEEPYDFVTFHGLLQARRVGAQVLFFTWQNLLRRFPPPFSWWESYLLRHVDGAIVGSTQAGTVLARKGYRGPLATIPQFGIDPHFYAPERQAREPEPQEPFRIGFAGRLVPEKGALLLLKAAAALSGPWELRIAGEGPELEAILRRAQALGVSQQVRRVPWLPSGEMPGFYRSLDTLVVPSLSTPRWVEQFGRVLVEAMACGVPVVGSSSGEIPQVIGEAGLVFPEGDEEALRAALQRLMKDRGLRRELARRGRERVLEHYTHQRVAAETYRFYEQLLAGRKAGTQVT